jgi:transcription elongation factor GreA
VLQSSVAKHNGILHNAIARPATPRVASSITADSQRRETDRETDMEFVTQEEKDALQAKLDALIANRTVLAKRINEAREQGDLKENADYHAARDDQGLEEAEIKRLQERLANAQVADDVEKPDDMVFLGSVVKLKDTDDDTEDLYKLVGEASGNFDADEIEVTASSPLGEALMKSRVGETVKADLPRGTKHFEVLEIL